MEKQKIGRVYFAEGKMVGVYLCEEKMGEDRHIGWEEGKDLSQAVLVALGGGILLQLWVIRVNNRLGISVIK